MILPVEPPPNAVAFRIVFAEFHRAYPLGLERFRSDQFADELQAAVAGFREELRSGHPMHMLQSFRERLEAVDHGRIILVQTGREPVEMSPDLLRWAEPEPARFGLFTVHPMARLTSPLARHSGAMMYLPDEVAASMRATWPALPTAEMLAPNAPPADWIGSKERSRGGRPEVAGDAEQAYWRRWPNGHAPLTWKEAAAALRDDGIVIHHDTLAKTVRRNPGRTDKTQAKPRD